jgi:hypothetical protein
MEDWRRLYLSYVQYECTSYSQKAAGKRARRVTRVEKRRRKAFIKAQQNGPSTIDDNVDLVAHHRGGPHEQQRGTVLR